jgi:hypothetical protein
VPATDRGHPGGMFVILLAGMACWAASIALLRKAAQYR